MTLALSLACAGLTIAVLVLVHAVRSHADVPNTPESSPAPAAASPLTSDDVLLELIRLVRTQQSDAMELHRQTIAALERIAVPAYALPADGPSSAPDSPSPVDLNAIAWDPTDSDPWLGDPEFGRVAPDRPQVNDAPDIITHPLGIPGLTFASPVFGEMRVNGSGGVVSAGVV